MNPDNHSKATAENNRFAELLASSHPVLVSFGAEWCDPCKWLEPILEELKEQLGDKVDIHKIDVDRYAEIAAQYHIRSVPTLLLFIDGHIKWRYQGFDTPAAMKKIILEHL